MRFRLRRAIAVGAIALSMVEAARGNDSNTAASDTTGGSAAGADAEPTGTLQFNRELANSSGLIATMIVILVIGVAVDSLVFGTLDRAIRRRWGLLDPAR